MAIKIFENIKDIKNIEPEAVALGNFDGVHRGHSELISRTVSTAKSLGIKSGVFTFANHPRNVLAGKTIVKSILYKEEKYRTLEEMGVDYVFNLPFTLGIQTMDPMAFIEVLLMDKLNMKQAYCGFNYTFGYKAKGTPKLLLKESIDKGFGLHVLEPYKIEDQLVSSTYIRDLIEKGDMERCELFMGRRYHVAGEVVVGNRLGKSLGFPTSNLIIDEEMVAPPNGVYITNCIYNGKAYPSITNVGVKPTVGEFNKNIETHIFDFDKELYGKHIMVEFIKKTRDEKKFDSLEELSEQIKKDCIGAREYHKGLNQ